MRATIEISMYALTDKYEESVISFIQQVKQNKSIRVEVNGLSTQLFGEYDELMSVLSQAMKQRLLNEKAVFLLKIGGGELSVENLPTILK